MVLADSLFRDLRHGLRSLLLRPGFTLTVVATLALGLGVNAAIFSLFHEVLLRPLPVPEPQRLVNLSGPGEKSGWMTNDGSGDDAAIFSYPMFRDLERAQDGVTLAGHRGASINLEWQGRTSNNQASMVSGNYFSALGLVPALGRLLSPQDDAVDGRAEAEAVVLAHGLWQDRFGADPDIIGQTLRINGLPMTVVGVAAQGFEGTTVHSQVELFLPISVHWPDRPESLPEHERRDAYWVYVFGRLAPGVTPAAALAPLQARYHSVINEIEAAQQKNMTPAALERFRDRQLQWLPGARGQSQMPEQLAAPLATLLAVAGLVLLIACVNIANLQLARGAGRRHEMSVRSAIGASSWRLARQLLVEAGLLALAGALLALPLGWLVARGLVWFDSTGLAGFLPGGLSWAMTGFVFAAAAVTVLLFGLFPAWQLSRATAADALRTRTSLAGHGGLGLRNGLAVAQMAFSLALLVLAGLFVRSLDNLSRVDLGMHTDQVLAFGIGPELNGYPPERSQALFQRLETELRALPGVDAVGLSMLSLVSDNNWGMSVSVQGYEAAPDERTSTSRNDVSPGFFQTLGIPLLAGRQFSDSDDAQAPRVAIVNQAFADRYGLGNDAVGKHVALHGGNPELDIRIVGVVGNSAYSGVRQDAPAQLYMPVRQNPGVGQVTVYLRSGLPTTSLGPAITGVVNRLDSGLPVMDLRSFSEQVRRNTGTDHLVGMLSSGFAVLATLLAAIGLYGLLAYAVAQRQHEMGLRLALGAPPARLRALVLRQTARLALIGIVIGLVLAVALGNAAASLLYGLSGQDPLVLALATLLLLGVVLAAAWWPAWRASRTDPMVALREE
ncbi:MAG: ABC transporter permease [Xanthomonadales bacterium]|nr:ABC transporter permease [Xanthomonadales bacterium]